MDLSYKERLFVSYYLGESKGNAADAARRAGYRETRVTPTRLLAKPSIRAAIDAKLDSVAMSQDEVLARLSDIAAASLGDFIDVGGPLWVVNLNKAKKLGKLHTLKKIKKGKEGDEIEVKDSFPALAKLAEYHGLFKQSEVQVNGGRVIILPPKSDGGPAGTSDPVPGDDG